MDPFVISALGAGLIAVFNKLLDKAVVDPALDHGLEPFRKWLTRGYVEARDEAALRKALLAALDETTQSPGEKDPERLLITLNVTGRSRETLELLAAAAVEMTHQNPHAVPSELLEALEVQGDRRAPLARFLFYFRQQLLDVDGYARGIEMANDLDARGLLAGITREIAHVSASLARIESIEEALIADRRLTTDDAEALTGYLDTVRKQLRYLPLPLTRSIPTARTDAELKLVFVPLSVRDLRREEKIRNSVDRMQRESQNKRDPLDAGLDPQPLRIVELSDILRRYDRFVLLGRPGSGKTTLLRRAALAFSEGRAAEAFGWQGPPLFPIFLRLRNFAAFLDERGRDFPSPGPGALTAYLDHYYRQEYRLKLTPDFFDHRLQEGHCLVLMDGLDEVTARRNDVAQYVNAFVRHYGPAGDGNRFGLSSRPRGYQSVEMQLRPATLAVCEVNPMGAESIRQLIFNLLGFLEGNERQRTRDREGLSRAILSSPELTEIAGTPLFCTALVLVYKYHGAALPQRRVDVFQEIVDLLLGFWKAQEQELAQANLLGQEDGTGAAFRDLRSAVDVKQTRLSHLAFHMQQERLTEIGTNDAQGVLANYLENQERVHSDMAETWARNFLYNAHERSGLLVEVEPDTYAYTHEGFREFLAATHLTNVRESEFIEAVIGHIQDDAWEQVILLAGAHRKLPNAWRGYVLEECLKAGETYREKGEESGWLHHLVMAGRMAGDMGENLTGPKREVVETVLYQAMTSLDLPPTDRVEAGDALDEMGWLPDDLYEFVRIPAGNGWSEFWIGKYPVTNRQYQRFLLAPDFADPELWQDFPNFDADSQPLGNLGAEAWEWLQDQLNGEGRLYPRFWQDENFGLSRRGVPVVGVSWNEANAYCHWLHRHWDKLDEGRANPGLVPERVRLPTEMEWLQAAGGAQPKNRYPWDPSGQVTQSEAEILRRANVSESGIGRTTPVGMYPLGCSQPHGLYDLAGNVWEWQANYRGADRYWRVLCGGSWDFDRSESRCASRGWGYPDRWIDYSSFRVMVSPSEAGL